jgi:hypothetical protein
MQGHVTLRQVAARLGVGPWRVRYAYHAGHVPEPPRLGRARRYGPDDVTRLERYFAGRRAKGVFPVAEVDGTAYRVWVNRKGYPCVTLPARGGRRPHLLHRVVYERHHGPVPPGWEVHHRDGDRANYSPGNLEAMERGAHREHHRRARSTTRR